MRQRCYTSTALFNITGKFRKALDEGSIGCRASIKLQKTFDTVDHHILLAKLNYYGICGISKDWFKSYLFNCNQFVSVNGCDTGLFATSCGVPRDSLLRLFISFLYIKDLNQVI